MELLQLKELDDRYVLNSYKRYPVQIVRGEGPYVFDEQGNRYLDFLSGIAVNALGYGHPAITEAIKKQAEELVHASNLFYTEGSVQLARTLCEISGMNKVFYCNSGAEANELAVKLARAHSNANDGKKTKLVCLKNSFHGRTSASLSVTKSAEYGDKFFPLLEEPVFVDINDQKALIDAVKEDTACVIIEPVQGEGGIHVATKEYLQLARELTERYNALLVFDEVQSGLGRTGGYFGYQFSLIQPDVITLAKPIAAGLPMGAVLMTDEVASLITYGDHGSTFGGNCICSAAALAFLNVMKSDKMLNHIREISKYLFDSLEKLKTKYSFIKDIRGRGLMIGIELEKYANDIHIDLMKDERLITNCTAGTVIRLLPPYIITKEHVDEAIASLDKIFSRYDQES